MLHITIVMSLVTVIVVFLKSFKFQLCIKETVFEYISWCIGQFHLSLFNNLTWL